MGKLEWPLSIEELGGAKIMLYERLSFLDVMKQHSSSIVECWHSDFTHKCTCPLHGNGVERTPSFYFSERSKSYRCFGCSASGDVFTLLSIINGSPWFNLVRDMLNNSGIDHTAVNLSSLRQKFVNSDIIYGLNFNLGANIRDYLNTVTNIEEYKAEQEWADRTFKRIDDRFANLDDSDQEEAAKFKIRIMTELERRKFQIGK